MNKRLGTLIAVVSLAALARMAVAATPAPPPPQPLPRKVPCRVVVAPGCWPAPVPPSAPRVGPRSGK